MSKLEEALEKARNIREEKNTVKEKKQYAFQKIRAKKIGSPYIVTVNEPESFISEEYRRLKSMLIRETKKDFLNTLMITSATNGEGKSLTAVNLAVTLAQEIDHSVILVEADIRKPLIHQMLDIKYQYGLTDYLSSEIDISDILIKTGIGKMVYVPAGSMVRNPVELLSSQKMHDFMSEIKHRYMDRYVIIDTPPVLACSETITMASYTDGTVFVVREGYVQEKVISEALNMLTGVNMLGIVYNSASKLNMDGYFYNYYSVRNKEVK